MNRKFTLAALLATVAMAACVSATAPRRDDETPPDDPPPDSLPFCGVTGGSNTECEGSHG